MEQASGKHFNHKGHSMNDWCGPLIEKFLSKSPIALNMRKQYYIKTFDTLEHGLNLK